MTTVVTVVPSTVPVARMVAVPAGMEVARVVKVVGVGAGCDGGDGAGAVRGFEGDVDGCGVAVGGLYGDVGAAADAARLRARRHRQL
ncbi:hypothetical protein, partial [Micromonospora harpali]